MQILAVNHDLEQIAVAEFANCTARQCLWADMSNTRARANPRESGIGNHRNMLAPRQVFERDGNLGGLLHSCSHRSATNHHDHIAWFDRLEVFATFDGIDRVPFAGEHPGATQFAVHAVWVNHAGVNGGAFDHTAKRCDVARRKGYGTGDASSFGNQR